MKLWIIEEMTYVEGAAFAPFKYMGKAAAKALLTKYAGSIAGKLGWCITKLGLAGGWI